MKENFPGVLFLRLNRILCLTEKKLLLREPKGEVSRPV